MEILVDATPEQCVEAQWEYFVHGEWPYKGRVSRGENGIVFVEDSGIVRAAFRNPDKSNVSVSAIAESGGQTRLYGIAKDRRYARTLEKWMREELPRQAAAAEPTVRTEASGSTDIPDQIKKLAELRDAGAITDEEFERKKAELLERM
jgi:hypothetical protein